MNNFDDIIWAIFEKKSFTDPRYKKKLEHELKEIKAQMKEDYFLGLFKKGAKFPRNENNLLVPYLLNIVKDFDIEKPSEYVVGEYPDIDSDYIAPVRDYLRNEWAPKVFGAENICAIGNYSTFGIKSSLIDMARVHGKDRDEILSLTTKLGLKDEDGNTLTWEMAVATPELKKYCEENPDVAEAARRLVGRNRGSGKHAAGLIIASVPIERFVPLVKDKEGRATSAFVEGLHGTDLGPMGLIKFDLLSLVNLMQIALACKLVKERHGLKSICALEGKKDWSDTSYLNDPKALSMANEGKLKCIFQFDSRGIRDLVRTGGVTSFNDLVAYTALFRPGPLNENMHTAYVNRKRGLEKYEIHPSLEPILGKTYGVMAYQETLMKILSAVGAVPEMHCEIVRKAISKKKVEIFGKYKEGFIENGQKILGWDAEKVAELWGQIESFAAYGFNKAHAVAYTIISSRLLWLKAHYPLEFFAAVLSCVDEVDKIKIYKREAESMGVKVEPVHINKSKEKFAIVDDVIYMGFSNIKGIGDKPAARIVENQPYKNFEDFLTRYGPEETVIKRLLALRLFDDASPARLYNYYEYYKDLIKKYTDKDKRYESSKIKNRSDIAQQAKSEVFADFLLADLTRSKEDFYKVCNKHNYCEDDIDYFWKVYRKVIVSKEKYEQKKDDFAIVGLHDYEGAGVTDPALQEVLCEVPQIAENEYYGFSWKHLLESSADYQGDRTFADFDDNETIDVRACEVHVVQPPVKRTAKNKKTVYYTVNVEDANSRMETVTFWNDDYERFKEELEYWENDVRKGHFLSIRLKRPTKWKNYTFDSPTRQFKSKQIPTDKSKDYRLKLLARPSQLTENDGFIYNAPKVLLELHRILKI